MNIYRYTTKGGKDLIKEYLDSLPKRDKAAGYEILRAIEQEGLVALNGMNIRQLRKKLWEIKFNYTNRMMYVIADENNMYILHACKKQKGKAGKFNIETAIKRAKELEKELNKKFI